MNYIDLTVFENETLNFKTPEGKIINITKPSQRMVIEMLKFKNINGRTSAENVIKALNNIIFGIFNSNDEGYQFDIEYIENGLNTQMKLAIVQAYSDFITKVQANPN